MKTLILVMITMSSVAFADSSSAPALRSDQIGTPNTKLHSKTEHNFSDLMIKGKYQYPDESLIKVDDDKLLTDLIGYRKDFRDRLNRMDTQGTGL